MKYEVYSACGNHKQHTRVKSKSLLSSFDNAPTLPPPPISMHFQNKTSPSRNQRHHLSFNPFEPKHKLFTHILTYLRVVPLPKATSSTRHLSHGYSRFWCRCCFVFAEGVCCFLWLLSGGMNWTATDAYLQSWSLEYYLDSSKPGLK